MAVQGEREQGVLGMDLEIIESMAQDEMSVQNMPVMQVELPPQTNPELKMGAAAGPRWMTPPSPPPSKSFRSPRRIRAR